MLIGSMYSGLGGLDLACEWALSARTAWQLDLVGAAVRRRHWPDALQIEADVATVDPLELPPVDVLCGGFACQDLSAAGTGAGLIDGSRTGPTYRHLCRFAAALRPGIVVMENVPALLSRWREHMEADWQRLGYGLTWVRARALDVGAPHRRARVFVVAEQGAVGRGVLDAPTSGQWSPVESEWTGAREGSSGLAGQVRTWPTPMSASTAPNGHSGSNRALPNAVRPWPTPAVRDYRVGSGTNRDGTVPLSESAAPTGGFGRRLSPAWVECLMGLPCGWTETTGSRLEADPSPRWPRGRYPAEWDRSHVWPGYDWEPARTLPDGPPARGRPARIRAMGNAVVPQQGALAIQVVHP